MQSYKTRDRAGAPHASERPIGSRDQAPGEGDSFLLVAIEERCVRPTLQDSGEFPGEVHRVADAGVHALPTHRAVDVSGVAEQERTTLAETFGEPMLHAPGRQPVPALD